MYGSSRPASKRRREYKRSQTVSAIPLGRINKFNSISETASGNNFPSENVSRRCSSGPSITQQNSSTSLTSRTGDNRRQSQQQQQRHRKTSSTSSSSYAFQEASTSASRKSSDGSLNGVRYHHPPLLSSVSYGPRKSSQQSVIAAAAAWATSKRLGRAPSSPSVLFTKVKEKIKEKVVEASSEWPQMAIIIHERRQRAAVEFEARLQQQQRQILQQLPPHQQLLFQQQLLQQQQRRESLRTISSDQIVLSNRQHQQQQQISKRRHRAKSDSGQRTYSYDKDNFSVGFIHHKDAIFQAGEPSSRPPSCNRSNSSSSNASVTFYQPQQSQHHHHHPHKGIFGFKNSSRRRGHLLSRLGGSVDVQTARNHFRRRSISDDVTNQPSQGASGHVGKSMERKVSKCGTGIVCSDDDIRAIVFEHKQRTSPGQQQRKSTQATTTTMVAPSLSTTATVAPSSATTTTASARGILLKQRSIERYSPEPTCSTSSTCKDTASLFHLAKPYPPSDRDSESGNSTSRASPVKPRSVNSDYEVDDVCINLTESENETSQAIPIKGDHLIDENETMKQFPSAAMEKPDEIEVEPPPLKSVEIPEVTFDEKGQTWDVYGAEFDPEILGQAIQHHLEKLIEKKFKDDETESKSEHVSPEERQKENKRARMMMMMMMNNDGNEYLKLSLLRRRDSAGHDVNNAASAGDNRPLHRGGMYDVSNNNHICRDSSDSGDNASTSDNESVSDNVSYRRRFTNLISRYLCSLLSRRSHAQSVS